MQLTSYKVIKYISLTAVDCQQSVTNNKFAHFSNRKNNMKANNTFIPNQPRRHFRLGVSQWGQMKAVCLYKPTDASCEPGFELEIFRILMVILNFTVQIKYSNVQGCGDIYKNGTTTGLLHMLEKNEIDIIGNLCTMENSRRNLKWLNRSWPVLHQKQAFLIKAPELQNDLRIFAPFTISLWIFLFFVIFLFLLFFVFVYKILAKKSSSAATKFALKDIYAIIFGFDCNIPYYPWIYLICFAGCIQIFYSTFFTISALKPNDIERPFRDHVELAENLLIGKHKVLDYKPNPVIQCYSDDVCTKIQAALESHGYFRVNKENEDAYLDNNNMLQILLDNPEAVLTKSRYTLMTYLDRFKNRSKLWLIDDDLSGNIMYAYFYRSNFELAEFFDRVLILLGDGKDNINRFYYALSSHAVQSKKITGKLADQLIIFNMELLHYFWLFYSFSIVAAILAFIVEIIFFKRKKN